VAEVYRRIGGRVIQKYLALEPGVQEEMAKRAFEIEARAEQLLLEHREEGHAQIEIEHGNVDWYVVLSDERGDKAALSIEYGRQAGFDPKTGRSWGEMAGLYILHQAAHLPIVKKGKVRL
jgi:hypothetical protein